MFGRGPATISLSSFGDSTCADGRSLTVALGVSYNLNLKPEDDLA